MNASTDVAAEGAKFETYDYPGGYAKKFNKVGSVGGVQTEADKLTRLRMEMEETDHTVMGGMSNYRVMTSGYKFDVIGGFAEGSYLLTESKHWANQVPAYGNLASARRPYINSFRAIPGTRPFVPKAAGKAVTIHGLQTAFVIDESKSGNTEEIWPDKYGRVRVRFHWDREGKYACWLRVVQPWAGKAWGRQWIPRVGDEVAVTFLEGDPDCPVVMGGLYNAQNMPVFSLPDNKTQSGILTRSSKGGGPSNFNMLRFEDKMGSEEVHLQAEKDLNSLVKNDETRTVKANRTSVIHVNDTRTVETGNDTVTVQQGLQTVTVEKTITTTSKTENIITTAQQSIATTAHEGSITITAETGAITVTTPASLTLKCGSSTIQMTPNHIIISATRVDIN